MSPAPPTARRRLTVVIVEENKTQRAMLRRVLEADGDIEVVGEASSSEQAVDVVRTTKPKVVTLDLQIQGGGIDAIATLMRTRPTPILVLSVAVEGAWATRAVDALAAGAAEVLPKPMRWDAAAQSRLREEVRAIGRVRIRPTTAPTPAIADGVVSPAPPPERVVAIAASTGGPVAVANVLSDLQGVAAPVLVVQHLHADFVPGFVSWLAKVSTLPVKEAVNGERLKNGVVYIGPGEVHLRVGAGCAVSLDAHPETVHRPSADELFRSVAAHIGSKAVGVLLTGMGADGAAGLRALRDAGATTIVQDEATSAVYGMPQAAVKLGAAGRVLPVDRIGAAILAALARPTRPAS